MKYSIVCKNDELSQSLENKINNILLNNGASIDVVQPDVIISIGGDGTMLRAIHKYIDQIDNIKFVGIHTGTLGFFTNYTVNDIELLCDNLLNKVPQIDEYSLIEVTADNNRKYFAVNELRVENNHHTQEIEILLNDEYLQTFKGNGICLSTAIGSTGYNRSLKGPIINPSLDVMIMSEIAAIQHRVFSTLNSPLVMDRNTVFTMRLKSTDHVLIGVDHEVIDNENFEVINCRLCDKKIKMLNYNEYSYIKRLRRAFLESK